MKARLPKRDSVTITTEQYLKLQEQIASRTIRDGAVQGIAAVLYGMSLHGYGPKRLNEILGWAQEVLAMPKMFNKEVTADDVLDYLLDQKEVDVDSLRIRIDPTYAARQAELATSNERRQL